MNIISSKSIKNPKPIFIKAKYKLKRLLYLLTRKQPKVNPIGTTRRSQRQSPNPKGLINSIIIMLNALADPNKDTQLK